MFKKQLFASILAAAVLSAVVWLSPSYAQGAPAGNPPSFGETISSMLPMLGMVFVIFYVLVIRPQQKKFKDQQDLIASLKKGEVAVTSSGIIGKISAVEKDHVLLEISNNVKVKFEPSHVIKKFAQPATQEAK